MRKKFLTVAATAVMTMSMLMSAFADTEKDLIAHYKFDENMKNEVSGEEAVPVGKGQDATVGKNAVAGDAFTYEDGVDDKAIVLAKGNKDGLNLNVKAKGDSYTMSVWVKTSEFNGFAEPLLWYGGTDQSTQSWVGIWPGLADKWGSGGPVLGAAEGGAPDRVDVTAGTNKITTDDTMLAFDWHMVTAVVDGDTGKLYWDGQLVGMTSGDSKIFKVTGEDKSFYLAANAWDVPFSGSVDELYIYDRALSTDDVKELYTVSNVAKVPAASLEEYKEPETRKPQLAQKGEFTSTKEDSSSTDEDSDNTMMIVIIAVVVVVVVIVVVAVASSSKKKNKSEE